MEAAQVWMWMDSPVGRVRLVASDAGLEAVMFEQEREGRVPLGALQPRGDHPLLLRAREQLDGYFAGTRKTFEVPLSPRGTPFQQQCWQALLRIPYGQTRAYGEQALMLGDANKARAVGAANGRNPLAILIPCHRVVAGDGTLGGFAGGLHVKRWLLDWEARHIHAPRQTTLWSQ